MITINKISVFGDPIQNAVDQMVNCMKHPAVRGAALMADHHLGYAMPIGGVLAYEGHVSPSGVGFDIACGNKAVMLEDVYRGDLDEGALQSIMDDVVQQISFGVGGVNPTPVDHDLFYYPEWEEQPFLTELKQTARDQLGTTGSGNHYVDIFHDLRDRVWVGVHFGSRGLGHKIASHFIKEGGGKDGINADPVVLDVSTSLGQDYLQAMGLAGSYAYAGRDWVCQKVADIIGAPIVGEMTVHNHHNFAWLEDGLWVVRKGATPAKVGQRGFIGSSMGENSYIVVGAPSVYSSSALNSTVHGAGRVMSRTQAAGKSRWKKGVKVKISEGCVTQDMMDGWTNGIVRRGGGLDESPDCYKRLDDVLNAQHDTIQRVNTLAPMAVAMA